MFWELGWREGFLGVTHSIDYYLFIKLIQRTKFVCDVTAGSHGRKFVFTSVRDWVRLVVFLHIWWETM